MSTLIAGAGSGKTENSAKVQNDVVGLEIVADEVDDPTVFRVYRIGGFNNDWSDPVQVGQLTYQSGLAEWVFSMPSN